MQSYFSSLLQFLSEFLTGFLAKLQAGDLTALLFVGMAILLVILLAMIIVLIRGDKQTKLVEIADPIAEDNQMGVGDLSDREGGLSVQIATDKYDETEGFKLFKRTPDGGKTKENSNRQTPVSTDNLTVEEHLRFIEKHMIRLQELFKNGDITRDIYVDETRHLYHQARAIAKLD